MAIEFSLNTADMVVNIIFGLIAALIGIVTMMQGYKAYQMWQAHGHGHRQEDQGPSKQDLLSWIVDELLTVTSGVELGHGNPRSASI